MALNSNGDMSRLVTVPAVSPERVASAAANGITLNAEHHRGDIPAASYMLVGEKIIAPDFAVGALSAYRRRLADAVAADEPAGATILRNRELEFLAQHGDANSPTRFFFESALHETLDDLPSAMKAYEIAMQLAREQGVNGIEQ